MIKEATDMMGIELAHTMAYSKQENAIVEKTRLEAKTRLKSSEASRLRPQRRLVCSFW
jgi:hypothetical protein